MDHLTLSERVSRLENILVETEVAGDRNDTQQAYNEIRTDEYLRDRATRISDVEQHFEQAQPRPKQADQTALEEIIQRISSCNDRVCLTAARLQRIGDRIMGALPEATDEMAGGSQKTPDGTLDHTFMALNWLDASLSRLEQVAFRMERV